jgi:hypothetical protein
MEFKLAFDLHIEERNCLTLKSTAHCPGATLSEQLGYIDYNWRARSRAWVKDGVVLLAVASIALRCEWK